MAERDVTLPYMTEKLLDEMGMDLYKQLQINTEYLNRLQNIEDQDKLRKKFDSSTERSAEDVEQTVKKSTTGNRVVDILKELLSTNQRIAEILDRLGRLSPPAGFRDSAISSSSDVSSGRDISAWPYSNAAFKSVLNGAPGHRFPNTTTWSQYTYQTSSGESGYQ